MYMAARWLRAKLGRRGVALVILGLSKMLIGLACATQTDPDTQGLSLLTRWAEIQHWALVWVVCGAIAFTCAWLNIGRDWLGFYAALIPPFIWGFAFLWGSLSGEYPRGIALAAWFGIGHVGLILWAATVPEHCTPHLDKE